MENLEIRVINLEHWRNGNGAKGAEERLQGVEQGLRQIELRHHHEEIGAKQLVNEQLSGMRADIMAVVQRRDKALVERLKAFAPYVAMAVGLVSPLLR
jgi:hypothetical protein